MPLVTSSFENMKLATASFVIEDFDIEFEEHFTRYRVQRNGTRKKNMPTGIHQKAMSAY
jgi:hypothetical protein